jgi:hypothetical protein
MIVIATIYRVCVICYALLKLVSMSIAGVLSGRALERPSGTDQVGELSVTSVSQEEDLIPSLTSFLPIFIHNFYG